MDMNRDKNNLHEAAASFPSTGKDARRAGRGLVLILYRTYLAEGYTLGRLYFQTGDEKPRYVCDTLEPQVRQEKVMGMTAIPEGTYKVTVRYSQKFRKQMPFLVGVPDFSGIMIHPGNHARHTQGCILVGELLSKDCGVIQKSADTFKRVFSEIRNYYRNMQEISITITHRTYEEYQRQEGGR